MKNAFALICGCKNNHQIWCHNPSTWCSHDVTDQLWWCHNAKSEKTVLDDSGKMSRADSRFAPSQWETSLQSNAVSHWLSANLESALNADSRFAPSQWETSLQSNAISHWWGANLESALNEGSIIVVISSSVMSTPSWSSQNTVNSLRPE